MNKRIYMKALQSRARMRGAYVSDRAPLDISVGQSSSRHKRRTKLLSILDGETSVRGAKLRGQTIVDY